jgi:uncharacterized protein
VNATGDGDEGGRPTYLLVDGENLDATLGNSILGRRPAPEERPRWERVVSFVEQTWAQPVQALFFLNASSGHLPMGFLQALTAMGLRPVLLSGPDDVKVVDVGIQRTLAALRSRDADVVLGSHDGDFLPQVRDLLDGSRRVAVIGFTELVSGGYRDLAGDGVQIFDLESDAQSFNVVLPRMRIIAIDDFDPEAFL